MSDICEHCGSEYLHHYPDGDYCFGCGKSFRAGNAYKYITGNTITGKSTRDIPYRDISEVLKSSRNLSGPDFVKLQQCYNIKPSAARRFGLKIVVLRAKAKTTGGLIENDFQYLFLPVPDAEGRLSFWQAKWWDRSDMLAADKKLKYTSPKGGKHLGWRSWHRMNRDATVASHKELVIVEGILDGIRMSEFRPTLALLGTHATPEMLELTSEWKRVTIWLDDNAYAFAVKLQQQIGRVARVIRTKEDPKKCEEKQILQLLGR